MKAIINPRTGIFKQITEENFKTDEEFIKKDGFRLMNDKEIQKHYGYKPKKAEPEKKVSDKK